MDENRYRKLAGVPLLEQGEVEIVKAGKLLGQVEKMANQQGTRFDKEMRKTRSPFLRAVAASLVWSLIESRIDDWTGTDIEDVADDVGMTVEEFSKANPKTVLKLIIRDAMDDAEEKLEGDSELLDLLGIDLGDMNAHINGVKF